MNSIAPDHCKAIAQRIVNAENGFVECIQARIDCTADQGRQILALYRRLRVVKLDAGIGRFNVVHGMYLDAETLHNALAQVNA